MKFKNMPPFAAGMLVLFAVLFTWSFRYISRPLYNIEAIAAQEAVLKTFEQEKVSDSALLEMIRAQDIRHEYHVLAQAIVESYGYKSSVFRETNNLFGMRYPGKRSTLACGIYLSNSKEVIRGDRSKVRNYLRQFNFSVYENWYDAVKDYKVWQKSVYRGNEDYSTFLQRVYATAPAYHQVIEKLAAELQAKYGNQ